MLSAKNPGLQSVGCEFNERFLIGRYGLSRPSTHYLIWGTFGSVAPLLIVGYWYGDFGVDDETC
jgi:hypothetical protein